MKPFTDEQYRQLLENGSAANRAKDHIPVVLLRLSLLPCYWLLTEISPDQPTEAFGLFDLGSGHTELGYVDIDQLLKFQSLVNVPEFNAQYPLSIYAEASIEICSLVLEPSELEKYTAVIRTASPSVSLPE